MDITNPPRLLAFAFTAFDYTVGALPYRTYAAEVASHLRGDERVFELGSGWGALSRLLAAHLLVKGGRLTCADVSEFWIEHLKRRLARFPNVDFVHGDIASLNLEPRTHDAAVIRNTLHHIEPEKRLPTLEALARVLKPRALLFVREPTKESHGIPASEIRTLASTAGFTETEAVEKKTVFRGVFRKS